MGDLPRVDVPTAYRDLCLLYRKSEIHKFHAYIWRFQWQRRLRPPFHLLRLAIYLRRIKSVRDPSESPGKYTPLTLSLTSELTVIS